MTVDVFLQRLCNQSGIREAGCGCRLEGVGERVVVHLDDRHHDVAVVDWDE